MTFMMTIYLKEGLVMASSRLATNALFSNSKNTSSQKCIYKTFNDIGIAVFGNAVYDYENLIESFILMNNNESLNVSGFSYKFNEFLKEMDLQSNFCFHIGGFEKEDGKNSLKVYKISYPQGTIELLNTDIKNNTVSGIAWAGEENIIDELLKPLFTINIKGDMVKLPEYSMPWELFDLEEAIDFAFLAIKNSFEIKNNFLFSAVEVSPIDILVITSKKSEWFSFNNPDAIKKELVQHAEQVINSQTPCGLRVVIQLFFYYIFYRFFQINITDLHCLFYWTTCHFFHHFQPHSRYINFTIIVFINSNTHRHHWNHTFIFIVLNNIHGFIWFTDFHCSNWCHLKSFFIVMCRSVNNCKYIPVIFLQR